ncbi:MAG: ParA family protein [Acetobacter sp.]|nr:ParA family protein [Bacteroides sp.]MCM1341091.1 ParA family protein [Acetobacter sp.]MCM1433576.1 ParA family protein [Clostridiales bacterium]
MCTSLALISGKGGSGKTTLGLALSELLAVCDKKVLLMDCDMSTHGATYFFEPYLKEKSNIITTKELLFSSQNEDILVYKKELDVQKNISFVPSCVEFPSKYYENPNIQLNQYAYEQLKKKYDVIIFDCQAGFSFIAERVTEISDIKLLVMESDAVSTAAVRVLNTQLGNNLIDKTYQVFNKIDESEKKLYTELVFGTFYTNLTPILFDWSIKRAFGTNSLPDVDENNDTFTDNIYQLAADLFPFYKKDLDQYLLHSKIKKKKLCEIAYEKKQRERKKVYMRKFYEDISMVISIIAVFASIIVYFITVDLNDMNILLLSAVAVLICVLFLLYFVRNINNKKLYDSKRYDDLKNEIKCITDDIEKLRSRLKKM